MVLDSFHQLLELPAQSYCLRAKDQLMQVLPVVRLHSQTGVRVLVDEDIVEHHKVRQGTIPGVVLEDRRWRSAAAFEDDMRRMLGRKASALRDWQGIPCC
jgi:hypothetical protein